MHLANSDQCYTVAISTANLACRMPRSESDVFHSSFFFSTEDPAGSNAAGTASAPAMPLAPLTVRMPVIGTKSESLSRCSAAAGLGASTCQFSKLNKKSRAPSLRLRVWSREAPEVCASRNVLSLTVLSFSMALVAQVWLPTVYTWSHSNLNAIPSRQASGFQS